jgi:hypothetical protein
MPVRRVILKKTRYFPKGKGGGGRPSRSAIGKYLQRYMDEVGKAKYGEHPRVVERTKEKSGGEEKGGPLWLLPEERTGIFYTGGFLCDQKKAQSPGSREPNKQMGWVKAFSTNWCKALEKHPKRQSDGLRFVLSLSPAAVEALGEAGLGCDQALREIWRTTLDLYRKRHGWEAPADDIAWIAGAHHDTDNAHLHILVFPTTKSGKPLRTNNARRAKENDKKIRIDDLNEMAAMANIAAEMYWRDLLPFELQSLEFQEEMRENPSQEPDLPGLEDYKVGSGIWTGTGGEEEETEPKKEEKKPKKKMDLASWEEKGAEKGGVASGAVPILDKMRRRLGGLRGRLQLRAMAVISTVWGKRKLGFWGAMKSVTTASKTEGPKIKEALKKEFPDQMAALEALRRLAEPEALEGNATKGRLARTIERAGLGASPREAAEAGAALALAMGEPEDPESKAVLDFGTKLASTYDSGVNENDPVSKLKVIEADGAMIGKAKRIGDRQCSGYRRIRRALLRSLRTREGRDRKDDIRLALELMEKILRGSKRLNLAMEARKQEAQSAVRSRPGKSPEVRRESREWKLGKKDGEGITMVAEKNEGKPWPRHLDPETVLEPLKGEAKITGPGKPKEPLEKEEPALRSRKLSAKDIKDLASAEGEESQESKEEENPLRIILDLRSRRSRRRRQRAMERMEKLSKEMEMELDGPDAPETPK